MGKEALGGSFPSCTSSKLAPGTRTGRGRPETPRHPPRVCTSLPHGRPSELQGSSRPSKRAGRAESVPSRGEALSMTRPQEGHAVKFTLMSSFSADLGAARSSRLPAGRPSGLCQLSPQERQAPWAKGIQKGWTLDGTTSWKPEPPGWLANASGVMGPWGAPSTAHAPRLPTDLLAPSGCYQFPRLGNLWQPVKVRSCPPQEVLGVTAQQTTAMPMLASAPLRSGQGRMAPKDRGFISLVQVVRHPLQPLAHPAVWTPSSLPRSCPRLLPSPHWQPLAPSLYL